MYNISNLVMLLFILVNKMCVKVGNGGGNGWALGFRCAFNAYKPAVIGGKLE